MNENTKFSVPTHSADYPTSLVKPVEPGDDLGETAQPVNPASLQSNRAELVLLLGILSLFLCGPLGLAAWIMGTSDLKKIRQGTMSPRKIGTLKLGRALGIAGTALFIAAIGLAVLLIQRGITDLSGIVKTQPLPPNQIAFAGEWVGEKGTLIRIRPDGRGDFKSHNMTVTGGTVSMGGESLTIGIIGISKTWHIDSRPHFDNGHWTMKLDGELFTRKGEGYLVQI